MNSNDCICEAKHSSHPRTDVVGCFDGEHTCQAVLGTSAAPPAPACAAARSEVEQVGAEREREQLTGVRCVSTPARVCQLHLPHWVQAQLLYNPHFQTQQ